MVETFRHIQTVRPAFMFLMAYWLYIDGGDTVVRMAVDYGLSLGFAAEGLMSALLVTQLVGFPAALAFGRLGERHGPIGIGVAILVYLLTIAWASQMDSEAEFYGLAVVIGLVQGGIQSLSRSRAVAGNAELGRRFQELAARLTDFRAESVAAEFLPKQRSGETAKRQGVARSPARRFADSPLRGLVAYTPDWKAKIAQMRQRIEKERTPAGQDALAIKTGAGGLMDAEFIAQALSLEHGWHEANTQRCFSVFAPKGSSRRSRALR